MEVWLGLHLSIRSIRVCYSFYHGGSLGAQRNMEGFEGRVYSGRYGGIGCHAFAVVAGHAWGPYRACTCIEVLDAPR